MGGSLALHLAATAAPGAVIAMATPVRLRPLLQRLARAARPVMPFAPVLVRVGPRAAGVRPYRASYPRIPLGVVGDLSSLLDQTRELLPEVRAPLLVAQGRWDWAIPAESPEVICARVASPVRRLLWLPHSSHLVTLDRDLDRLVCRSPGVSARAPPGSVDRRGAGAARGSRDGDVGGGHRRGQADRAQQDRGPLDRGGRGAGRGHVHAPHGHGHHAVGRDRRADVGGRRAQRGLRGGAALRRAAVAAVRDDGQRPGPHLHSGGLFRREREPLLLRLLRRAGQQRRALREGHGHLRRARLQRGVCRGPGGAPGRRPDRGGAKILAFWGVALYAGYLAARFQRQARILQAYEETILSLRARLAEGEGGAGRG